MLEQSLNIGIILFKFLKRSFGHIFFQQNRHVVFLPGFCVL